MKVQKIFRIYVQFLRDSKQANIQILHFKVITTSVLFLCRTLSDNIITYAFCRTPWLGNEYIVNTSSYSVVTYSMEQILFEKLTGSQLVKKFPAFYGTRIFINTLTRARHLFLSLLILNGHIFPFFYIIKMSVFISRCNFSLALTFLVQFTVYLQVLSNTEDCSPLPGQFLLLLTHGLSLVHINQTYAILMLCDHEALRPRFKPYNQLWTVPQAKSL